MLKLKTPLSFILLLVCFLHLSAQEKKDASYYLNDNNISISKNSLNISLASIINGDVRLNYERKLADNISISFGYGVLLPFYTINSDLYEELEFDVNERFDVYDLDGDRGGGRSYIAQFRYFVTYFNSNDFYMGMYYRNRKFAVKNTGDITYSDYMISPGYLYGFKRFQVYIETAVGLRFFDKNFETQLAFPSSQVVGTFNLSFGYKF